MEYSGHMSKRQRTNEGHGIGTGGQDKFDDPHKPPPSRVVHVRRLNEYASESHLLEAVQNFGAVRNIIMMKSRGQALIEFEDIGSAKNCVDCAQSPTNKIYVCGMPAFFNYSVSQEIHAASDREEVVIPANNILLFTIINPHYPITVDVMNTICSPSGNVLRIVIFRKNGMQCMVEFETVNEAINCKDALNGADIYSGCCTLKIDFARTERLNVIRNDSESWDYTIPQGGMKENIGKSPALLPDPQMGAGGFGGGYGSALPNLGGNIYNGPGPSQFSDQFEGGFSSGYGPSLGGDGFGPKPSRDMYNGPGTGYQQGMGAGGPPRGGVVLMVYGLSAEKMNCDRVFNLFCLYGNVMRVKFLKSKEGTAMVQMGDGVAAERCINLLKDCPLFDGNLQIGFSKQRFIEEVNTPYELPDGSLSYRDFSSSRNNRYMTELSASKNRCRGPTKQVHYFNAPPNVTVEELAAAFEKYKLVQPEIKQFPKKSEKSSSGLFEWNDAVDSVNGLVMVNHEKIYPPGEKTPYILRLCFSTPSRWEQE